MALSSRKTQHVGSNGQGVPLVLVFRAKSWWAACGGLVERLGTVRGPFRWLMHTAHRYDQLSVSGPRIQPFRMPSMHPTHIPADIQPSARPASSYPFARRIPQTVGALPDVLQADHSETVDVSVRRMRAVV